MKNLPLKLLYALLLTGCISSKKIIGKKVDTSLAAHFYENQFTGFFLFDPVTQDTLFSHNGSKYFTPASNTKIATLYASLQLLPDSIPALKYAQKNDTLYIAGTGDPSFLHPYFKESTVTTFLTEYENIAVVLSNFDDEKLGPGWAWGDYEYYYQPERNALPMYGNVVTLHNAETLQVYPTYFADSVIPVNFSKNRELEKNRFYFSKERKDTLEIPFRTDTALTKRLLEQKLNRKISLAHRMPATQQKVLYSFPSDSVSKRMMVESDNFLAEQLLILVSSTLSDTLNGQRARKHILENYLSDLKQPPRWVDGSGLSRYNLFTPESIVHILFKMYSEINRERLLDLFPAGGVSGTLEHWYANEPRPYIYAKSGSLSNNHCLSGYLITNSGNTLIFSFMNNHFTHSSSEVKKRMQYIFETIRDTY